MKNNIKDSVIATGGSKITNANIKTKNSVKKTSFIKGFATGVLSSVVASLIWYFIEESLK